MLWRFVWNRYGAVVVGVLLILLGVFSALRPAPTCDGVAMNPGDSCVERGRFGRERVQTYADKQRQTEIAKVAAPIVGVLLIGIGTFLIVRRRRTEREAQPTSA